MALPTFKLVVHFALFSFAASSAVKLCGLAGYETTNLTQASYWTIALDNNCFPDDKSAKCTFSLAFCQSLTSEDQPFDEQCDGAGACLVTESENTTTYDIGAYNNITANFKPKTYDDGAGFIYNYPSGEADISCGGINTTVNFVCDFKSSWIANPESPTPVPEPYLVEFNNKTCMYNITVRYSGACYTVTPSQPAKGSSLSVGSILLIIFIPAISLYFIIGCIINRLQGHQGEEILPHHDFWCGLPGYIRDGMKYAWAVVTCRNTDAEAKGYDSI